MKPTTLKIYVDTVKQSGEFIWVRPVCDFFQIDVRNQHKNIKKDAILSNLVGKNTPDLGENDKNGRILLTKKGFSRWIQIINPNIIPIELKEQFIEFQTMLDDFLYGSAELHSAIGRVRSELDRMKQSYSETGRLIQQREKELKELLDNVYQYRLPFAEQKQLT